MDYSNIFLYHITHINNLPNIVENKALLSYKQIKINNILNTSIAYISVQNHRQNTRISYPPYGNLHDYVPFYFAPRSPMLYAIYRHNVETYSGSQEQIIYLITNVQNVIERNYNYIFTDKHAIVQYAKQFNDARDLEMAIDWEIMRANYWANTEDDGERKSRRQAEFLIYSHVDFNDIQQIVVYNEDMGNFVKRTLMNTAYENKKIFVDPGFYY
ncbi:DUF4433 domain-containing protein [Megasphaera stantonii]|uniref:type II toxin-antitoxin system toxin DNA ADP-ribosyl transferase DarT n=1 Tax=Megasphaera stantonii TaxID=2144175 RepID=UPI002941BD37|nr:DUF4433 domain-containing protein [Megasphaera stantonii]